MRKKHRLAPFHRSSNNHLSHISQMEVSHQSITQVTQAPLNRKNRLDKFFSSITSTEGKKTNNRLNLLQQVQINRQFLKRSMTKTIEERSLKIDLYQNSLSRIDKSMEQRRKLYKYQQGQEQERKDLPEGKSLPKIEKQYCFLGMKKQNYRVQALGHHCYDNIFPITRYGPVIISNDKAIYLVGGFHSNSHQSSQLVFQYNLTQEKWVSLQTRGQSPPFVPCYHTVEAYKNYLIIIGGIAVDGQFKKKQFNSEIYALNLEKLEWIKIQGAIFLKNHASTMFGNTLMLHGGENPKYSNSDIIYFLNFASNGINSLQIPYILQVESKTSQGVRNQPISNHKMINTSEIEFTLRLSLRIDGVIRFGGVDSEGQMNNQLTIYACFGKNGQFLDQPNRKWELLEVTGEKPCARKNHTFNIINRRAAAVLIGGVGVDDEPLDDIWIFDLMRLSWSRINTNPSISDFCGQIQYYIEVSSITQLAYLDQEFMFLTDPSNVKKVEECYGQLRWKIKYIRRRVNYRGSLPLGSYLKLICNLWEVCS